MGREPIRKLSPADRLIKPLTTTYNYGLPVDHLIFGAAAALHFQCPEDSQSVELTEKIQKEGVAAALSAYTRSLDGFSTSTARSPLRQRRNHAEGQTRELSPVCPFVCGIQPFS